MAPTTKPLQRYSKIIDYPHCICASTGKAVTHLYDAINQGELVKMFSNTIQAIKDNTNGPLDYFEWRASATDTDPLTSDNWTYHRSNLQLDLESNIPIADQILDHQAEWGHRHR